MLENNAPVFDSGNKVLYLSAGTGSFGQYLGGIDISLSSKKWFLACNIYAQSAINNFAYRNNHGSKRNYV
jgi:hypothetical protein